MTTHLSRKSIPNIAKAHAKKNRLTLLLFVLFSVFILEKCPVNAQSDTTTENRVPNVVIATVNGQEILKSEIDMGVAAYKQRTGKTEIEKNEMTELVKSVIRRRLILSLPQVQSYRSDPLIIGQLREYENHLIISKYIAKNVGPSLNISEQQLRDYYDQNKREFSVNPKVEARHILLKNQEKAQVVLQLLKSGQDFSDLAKEHSIDLPMALEGGSMGVIEKGKTLPVLEKALFSLAEGEMSDIVETQYGYHIILVDKIHPASFMPFKEVRLQIHKTMIRRREAQAFDQMTMELEKTADITIYSENLSGPSS
ncbi:peptidyl-prolyl cis-trans isomerase [Desulfoluna sp.]|uniref:peptidylprolyl isomerase n=1 Tax=Desulfoluna sp. TaxID=2045199 RepID=UPI002633BB20|nr:peptidyl-prolyl cis-trans isomerase [Desulfoluna sp.]